MRNEITVGKPQDNMWTLSALSVGTIFKYTPDTSGTYIRTESLSVDPVHKARVTHLESGRAFLIEMDKRVHVLPGRTVLTVIANSQQ